MDVFLVFTTHEDIPEHVVGVFASRGFAEEVAEKVILGGNAVRHDPTDPLPLSVWGMHGPEVDQPFWTDENETQMSWVQGATVKGSPDTATEPTRSDPAWGVR